MKTASQTEAEAADWVAQRDSEDWSASEEQRFEAWLNEATANRIAFLRLESAWSRADRLESIKSPAVRSVPPGRSLWGHQTSFRLAASVLLATALGLGFYFWQPVTEVSTAVGESRSVALADGSRVMLNTSTTLIPDIKDGRREVQMKEGEAFFEVTHDPAHPFVIKAGANRVTVLGTKFSVRREGDNLQVAVVEGRVRVAAKASGRSESHVILGRDETAVAREGVILQAQKTSAELERQLSWRSGKLVLDRMTLAQAAAEFNRYNKRKLVIADKVAADIVIGGSFNFDNIDGFARLVQQGFGLRLESTENEIKIGG